MSKPLTVETITIDDAEYKKLEIDLTFASVNGITTGVNLTGVVATKFQTELDGFVSRFLERHQEVA